jgi:LysR family hydrogen peroxide-inducible transcriptional activator
MAMNFNQLKYIVSVDKHRSFARAADECDIAQSTLSKEIQRLEKEFGIIIFDRSRFPISTTMKGADLIEQAKKIVEEQRLFVETARKMNNRPDRIFRLGILPLPAPYLLPLFVASLAKKYPELQVEIPEITSKEMVMHFEDVSLDGAITISPFIKECYYEDILFKENFVLYISPKHPLFEKTEIKWKEIPLDGLILHEEFKHYFLPENKNSLSLNNKNINNIHYESGSLETIRKIIDINGGLTLLPGLACRYMGERRLKMARKITGSGLYRTISIVTPRGFEKNRITKVIKREILSGLPVK